MKLLTTFLTCLLVSSAAYAQNVIKFDTDNIPSFVTQDLLIDDKSTGQRIVGYLYRDPVKGDIRIFKGDYLLVHSDRQIEVVPIATYQSDAVIQDQIRELVGKESMRIITKAIRDMITDPAEKVRVFESVAAILMLLGDGFIQDARDVAAAKTITATYTAGRQTFLLQEIDKALVRTQTAE